MLIACVKRLCLFLLLASAANAQTLFRYENILLNQNGTPLTGVSVYVCAGQVSPSFSTIPPCTLATIWSDVAGTLPITQPVLTSPLGNYSFVVVPGTIYMAVFVGPGIQGSDTLAFPQMSSVTSQVSNGNPQKWPGSDPGAWINAAEASLPATGGIIDARGLTGAQTATTGIVLNKMTRLIFGAVTLTGPSSGDMITVNGPAPPAPQGTCIVGQGQNITILQPVTSAQAHGIHFTPTNNGNTAYCVEDLTINDQTQGGTARTAGNGIFADANVSPAQNSIGLIQNVKVTFMYNGIYLNRPITTKVIRAEVVSSKNDGIDLIGDGTTVSLDNTYSHSSGRYDYGDFGVNSVVFNTVAAQSSVSDGIHIDRNSTGAPQAIGTTITGADIEVSGGKGIYCKDCVGFDVSGINVLNVTGDGIHIDGGRGVSLRSGEVKGSGGCGVDVTRSATPIFPAIVINQGLLLAGNTGGNECGAALNSAYSSLGYDTSGLSRLTSPLVSSGSAATIAGTGACATITTQVGGAWGGSFKCTGTTGSSTITITIGTATSAPNGWNCSKAADITTTANSLVQTSSSVTQCALSGTVNANDVILWTAVGF